MEEADDDRGDKAEEEPLLLLDGHPLDDIDEGEGGADRYGNGSGGGSGSGGEMMLSDGLLEDDDDDDDAKLGFDLAVQDGNEEEEMIMP